MRQSASSAYKRGAMPDRDTYTGFVSVGVLAAEQLAARADEARMHRIADQIARKEHALNQKEKK